MQRSAGQSRRRMSCSLDRLGVRIGLSLAFFEGLRDLLALLLQ